MANRFVTLALAALAAATWLPAAWAGTFTISPLRVDLSRSTPTAALTVRNENDAEVVVQVEALHWSQADGQDVLDPTRDLIASPAVFTLPARGSQLIRLALRHEPDARRELSYRLVVQEVPPAPDPDFMGLQVALRMSLPVFVAALAPSPARLDWSAVLEPDGALAVTARNPSDTHARVLGFTAVPAAATAGAFDQPVAAYVLPGQSRRWRFGDGKAAATIAPHYQLRGRTDAGEFTAELPIAQ
jgi:fimbrial chaperone protein